jgi:hypothetical protein
VKPKHALDLGIRGSQYPMTGVYKIKGPNKTYLRVTFTPGGALKNVNKNLLAEEITNGTGKGPISMVQFAYSADEIDQALRERAAAEIAQDIKFKFTSVGDTPFSVQGWSGFLDISGVEQVQDELTGIKYYKEIQNSPWEEVLGKDRLKELRQNVFVGPPQYSDSHFKFEGKNIRLSGKIHHKGMVFSREAVALGTSFNFSKGAITNNEQIVIAHDPKLVEEFNNGFQWLVKESSGSVYNEVSRRNVYRTKQVKELYVKIRDIEDYIITEKEGSDAEPMKLKAVAAIKFLKKELDDDEMRDLLVKLGDPQDQAPEATDYIFQSIRWMDTVFKNSNMDVRISHKETGKELTLSSDKFSSIRSDIGLSGTEYENYQIDPKKSFRFFDDETDVGKDRLFKSIETALDSGEENYKGPLWSTFIHTMNLHSLAQNTVINFRGNQSKESLLKIFTLLKERKIIKYLPNSENIKIHPFVNDRKSSITDTVKYLKEIRKNVKVNDMPTLTSLDGNGSGSLIQFSYIDSDYKNLKMVQNKIQMELDNGGLTNTKVLIFFTGRRDANSEPFQIVLVPNKEPRELMQIEVLEWKKALSKGGTRTVRAAGSGYFDDIKLLAK